MSALRSASGSGSGKELEEKLLGTGDGATRRASADSVLYSQIGGVEKGPGFARGDLDSAAAPAVLEGSRGDKAVSPGDSHEGGVAAPLLLPLALGMIRSSPPLPPEAGDHGVNPSYVPLPPSESGSHSSLVPVAIDALSQDEIVRRLGQAQEWLNTYSGNREAKNFKEILKIFGTNYEASDEKTVESQRFDTLVARVKLSKTNAPFRLVCVFGADKLRSPETQKAYNQLDRILNQGEICLPSSALIASM